MSVDLEEVKQILRENALGMAELRKAQKKTDRQLRDLKKQVSGVDKNIGSGAEEYFQTALAKTLNFAGIQFDDITPNLARTRKRKFLRVRHPAREP